MKYTTVSSLCEGVAGAIREKEGSTALINPQDFVDRIKGLEVGGGGEEYGVYLKILDVNCSIDEVDTALKVDSPEVLEFFSDAFALGDVEYNTNYPIYSMQTMHAWIAKLAIEEKKKKLGKPNIFDSLQKKVPLLAFRTKEVVYEEGFRYPEKLIIVDTIWDYRSKNSGANAGSFYATTIDLHWEDVQFPSSVVMINDKGLEIYNYT